MSRHVKEFLSSGSWTCPAGVKSVQLEGCGGGGGGGGGYYTTNATNVWISGGSGGGGAMLGVAEVAVTPGVTYDITIGAGGTAGSATTVATTKAGDGGDTIFKVQGGATLATFLGAGAGYAGSGVSGSTLFRYNLGGQYTKFGSDENIYSILWILNVGDIVNYTVRPGIEPQRGGFTVGSNDTSMGSCSAGGPSHVCYGAAASFKGGTAGTNGVDASTWRGGSSGGGGGAGPYGPGGNAGNGGNANGSGQGAFGQPGTAGGANTGAGGGGGGAAGFGSSNVGVGGNGAAGGSGRLYIRWNT